MKLKKSSLIYVIGVVAVVLLVFFIINNKKTHKIAISIPANNLDITYGVDTAPIQIVMYSDYSCSYCNKFLKSVLPLIKEKYIKKGKVKFTIKLLTFSSNSSLNNAYKAAICLNKYGNFDKFNELLLLEPKAVFSEQFDELIDSYINRNTYFAECMLSGKAESYLSENLQQFYDNKFKVTPMFIINNRVYAGFVGYELLCEIINKQL